MKITEMLRREDFYAINRRTLDTYYKDGQGEGTLFVYPRLNAIVTARPSRQVKEYLHREYTMHTGSLKALAVSSYVGLCLASGGLLSAKKVPVRADVTDDTLIYPCNKKYRVFHFDQGTVDVIMKDRFSDGDLQQEIAFRTRQDLPDFVPPLVGWQKEGYREKIITGRPLARIYEGFDLLRQQAYDLLCTYRKASERMASGKDYAEQLQQQALSRMGEDFPGEESFRRVVQNLAAKTAALDQVPLGFSHGDLQAGNIWVEDGSRKIYIIDWESWGERSLWYDEAVLFDRLRPGSIQEYLEKPGDPGKKAAVLLEDLLFQQNEYNSLPGDFGRDRFMAYLDTVEQWLPGC